jgi:hypothetical protein
MKEPSLSWKKQSNFNQHYHSRNKKLGQAWLQWGEEQRPMTKFQAYIDGDPNREAIYRLQIY